MNNHFKQYWPVSDGSLLTIYKPTLPEADALRQRGVRREDKKKPYYQLPDGQVLLDNDEGGVLFESLADLKKFWLKHVPDLNVYSSLNPDGYDFLAHRYQYIKKMIADLALDPARMNYSWKSTSYLSEYLIEHYTNRRRELERYLLGLLAYCGETHNAKEQSKWYLAGPPPESFSPIRYWRVAPGLASPTDEQLPPDGPERSQMEAEYERIKERNQMEEALKNKYYWYPWLEFSNGEIRSVFRYFDEALLEDELPHIVLDNEKSADQSSKAERPPFVSPGGANPVTWDIHVLAVNKADIRVILANNPHVRLEEAPLPADRTGYRLEDGKILVVTEDHTEGKLFDSETYFYEEFPKEK